MPAPVAQVVNWGGIRDTVVLATIAGVGLAITFGCLMLGSIRAQERYSQGRVLQATAYGALAAAAGAATLAGIVLGLIAMSQK